MQVSRAVSKSFLRCDLGLWPDRICLKWVSKKILAVAVASTVTVDGTTMFGVSLIGVSLDAERSRVKVKTRELSVRGKWRPVERLGDALSQSDVGNLGWKRTTTAVIGKCD